MRIQEFIRNRNVSYHTVRQYIKNHQDLFHGHIGRRNKIVLDEVAVMILDKKYPVYNQIEIVQDQELLEQIVELQNEKLMMIEKARELELQLASQAHYKVLLEQKDKILDETRKNLEYEHIKFHELKSEHNAKKDEFNNLYTEYKSLQDDYNKLKEDYMSEKNKSWWYKLIHG